MIKFFRRIRQQLLEGGKFSKYLLYAFGEIVLVVIGILIALQINNLNSYESQRSAEKEYLVSLKAEFENNLTKVNESIDNVNTDVNAVQSLLRLFDPEIIDATSEKQVSEMIYAVFGAGLAFKPSTSVLEDMIASGNLNLILNTQLRQHLATFNGSLDFFKIQESSVFTSMNNALLFLNKNGSILSLMTNRGAPIDYNSISSSVNNRGLFKSVEFENLLFSYLLYLTAANNDDFLMGIKTEIKTILKEINNELKES